MITNAFDSGISPRGGATAFAYVILLLLCVSVALAQQATDVNSFYEGQKIAKVDLVGNAASDLSYLRDLVALKPGDSYSAARAEASKQALRLTGRFAKVETQVRAEPAGLSVLFILEPASYLGSVNFPGATKVFSYPRLLQVANLPSQDPYREEEAARAQGALVHFFQGNGFFLATVEKRVELDNAHQLANVIFEVNLGKRARNGQVFVTGPPPQESARLARIFRSYHAILIGAYLKPGRVYTREKLDKAQSFLSSTLSKQLHPANKVSLKADYHPETNRADLTFNVEEGPVVNIKVVGARLSIPFNEARTLRALVPIYEEGAFDRDLVEEGKRNIIAHFQTKGYSDVAVNTKINELADHIDVVYSVDKGHRHKVISIEVQGANHFSEDDLLSHVTITKGGWISHGRISSKMVAKSVDNLKSFYRNAGFEEVKVQADVVDHEPEIEVTFRIVEGPETVLDAVRYQGNRAFPESDLHPTDGPGLVGGQAFSQSRLNADRDRILARYLEQGYLNARMTATVIRNASDSHHVEVVYQIQEGPQVYISDVVFLGQKQTHQSYLEATTNLHAEQPLSQAKLLQAESRLYNLGILDWAYVGPRRVITDQKEEMVLVKTHEAKRNTITYGFGFEWSRRAGSVPSGTVALPGLPPVSLGSFNYTSSEKAYPSPRGSIEYTRRNLFGLGHTGAISGRFSRLEQRGAISYADPRIKGTLWDALFSASAERTSENPIFTARTADASFEVERFIGADRVKTILLRYGLRHTLLTNLLIPDLVPLPDRNVRLSSISASYIRDTRDKPLDAHKGIYQTFDVGITPKIFGSSTNFVHFLGQTAYYRELPRSLVWANSIRLGWDKPFAGSEVPLSEKFFSGGATSLRGFPINGAGPQRTVAVCGNPTTKTNCSNIRVPVGGNQLFILNSELRFPLKIKKGLGGVAFYDGGNVYDRISIKRFVGDYTNTVGFGVRYQTPVGPVRFDIAKRITPIPGISSVQYFFTVGQSF